MTPHPRTARRTVSAIVTLVATAIASVHVLPTTNAATPPAEDDHKVVFFAIDGFDAEYLDGRAPLPNIRDLARRGTLTTGTSVMSSMTNQAWSSTASGAYPERTLNAAYYLDSESGVVEGQSRSIATETLAEALVNEGRTIASVQWFILQDRGVTYGDPDALYTQPEGDCDRRGDDAVSILQGDPVESGGAQVTVPEVPDLLVMYCSDIDSAGHATGEDSQETVDALVRVDEQIGRVVEATRRAGTYDQTTFVLAGDHGITSYDDVNGPEAEAAIDAAGYEAEWVSTGDAPSADTQVALAGGGLTSVHLLGELADDAEALAQIEEALDGVEGIGGIYDKQEQAAMRMSPAYGQLVVEPDPNWAMYDADAPHTRGRHGTTQDLDVTFLMSGAGVRPHSPPKDPHLVDVAPTIAHLLSTDTPAGTQGRVLAESLRPIRP